jgi:hypothetical protein
MTMKYLKIILGLFVILSFGFSCKNQDKGKLNAALVGGKPSKFQFAQTTHDFGTITEGDVVEYTYDFKNVGEGTMLISEVKVTCGCTSRDWPKDPIAPGESGSIKVTFNSSGKNGHNEKSVDVIANTEPNDTRLTFSVNVKPKSEN